MPLILEDDLLESLGAVPVGNTNNPSRVESPVKFNYVHPWPSSDSLPPSGEVNDNTIRALDMDTPPARGGAQEMFDSSTYAPGGDTQQNREVFNMVGDQLPTGGRIQTVNEGTPEQERRFVTPPDLAFDPKGSWIGEAGKFILRNLTGGALHAGKGLAVAGEIGVDSAMNLSDQKDELGAPNFGPDKVLAMSMDLLSELTQNDAWSDSERNYFQENLATVTPSNEVEAVAQEIVAMAAGGVMGTKLVEAASATGSVLGPAFARIINFVAPKIKAADTANFPQKLELFVRTLAAELGGANIGAAITAPESTESLTGEGVDIFGHEDVGKVLPEQLPGLSEGQTNRVGHFIDGAGLSAVGMGIGRLLGMAGSQLGKFMPFKSTSEGSRNRDLLLETFRQIDPGVVDASEDEFMHRLGLFGEMVANNNKIELPAMGQEWTRSTTNAVMEGAKDYVEAAYGYLRETSTPEEWNEFVSKQSEIILNNISSIRRDNLANGAVQAADAITLRNASQALDRTFEGLGGPERVTTAGQTLGQSSLNRLDDIAAGPVRAQQGVDAAQLRLQEAQRGATEIRDLAGPRDSMGSTVDLENMVTNEVASGLYANTVRSLREQDEFFQAIPETLGYDKERLVDDIVEAGDMAATLRSMGIEAPSNLVRRAPDDPEALAEYKRILMGNLPDSLKELYNQNRRELATLIGQVRRGGASGNVTAPVGPLVHIKDAIQREMDLSGDTSARMAMDNYTANRAFYGTQKKFEDYETSVEGVLSGTSQTFYEDVILEGRELYQQALNDESGLVMGKLTQILNRYNPENVDVTDRIGAIIIGNASREISTMLKTGKDITSGDLLTAIRPWANNLHRVSPDLYERFQSIVTRLEAAENGLTVAEGLYDDALKLANDARKLELESVGAQFLVDTQKGGLRVADKGGVTDAFNSIFTDEAKTQNLYREALSTDDPDVLDGIRAQYVRWLRSDVSTSTPISGGGRDAVMGSSGSRLNAILNGDSDTPLSVMDTLWSDKPEFLADFKALLGEMQLDNLARQNRPQTFSSNTAIDYTRRKALNAMTTVVFGTLSRPGATIRNIISNVSAADQEKFKAQAEAFMGEILADSEKFSEIVTKIASGGDQTMAERARQAVSDAYGPAMVAGIKSGMQDTTPDDDVDEQTEGAFNLSQTTPSDNTDDLERIETAQVDDSTYNQMENLLSLWAQGKLSASEVQRQFPSGFKPNLRSKYGADVEITPTNGGTVFRIII